MKLTKFLTWLFNRDRDATRLFEIISYAITVTALLIGIEYFSGQASIDIRVSRMPPTPEYYMDTVQKFYQKYNYEIPKLFSEDKVLSEVFKTKDDSFIGVDTSDIDLIKRIKRGQEMDSLIDERIKELDKQLNNYRFNKRIYTFGSKRSFLSEESVSETLKYIKTKLSPVDYYVFLSAIIYSREIYNNVYIKNNGDANLSNIRITIPSPLSKITDSRRGNILDYTILSSRFHRIEENRDNLVIYLPELKKGGNFSLSIATRENQIEKDDILYSFDWVRTIYKGKIFLFLLLTLFMMCILGLFFKGRRSGE